MTCNTILFTLLITIYKKADERQTPAHQVSASRQLVFIREKTLHSALTLASQRNVFLQGWVIINGLYIISPFCLSTAKVETKIDICK